MAAFAQAPMQVCQPESTCAFLVTVAWLEMFTPGGKMLGLRLLYEGAGTVAALPEPPQPRVQAIRASGANKLMLDLETSGRAISIPPRQCLENRIAFAQELKKVLCRVPACLP